MKPCGEYKERIALAIVEDRLTEELQKHVSRCAVCRAYAEEVREICGEHANRAEALPEIEAPRRMRARVREAIFEDTSDWLGLPVRALRRLLQGFGIAAAATIIIAVWMHRSPPSTVLPPNTTEITKTEGALTKLREPTLATYHNRLARSVEELEASLQAAPMVNGGELLKVSSGINGLP
jgi:hypothetical protein